MQRLPKEVQVLIYEFDPTKKENMDHVIHQITFIPVLKHIVDWSNDPLFYDSSQWIKNILWYNTYFNPKTQQNVEANRKLYWLLYWNSFKNKIVFYK